MIYLIIMLKLDLRSEAIYETKQGTGLEILTPRQILQRLPIALAQVKQAVTQRIVSNKMLILSINQNKLLKKYVIT